jgi:hypothetical protein
MPRISRQGSGPALQAFKGEFAAVHNCTAHNKRVATPKKRRPFCSGHIFGIRSFPLMRNAGRLLDKLDAYPNQLDS